MPISNSNSTSNRQVSLSADGNTFLFGNNINNINGSAGVLTAFAFDGTNWVSQGLLKCTGAVGSNVGSTFALNADGNIAVVGNEADNNDVGAVWIFKRTNGVWAQQGDKIVATSLGEAVGPNVGAAVAISADGNIVMVAAPRDLTTSGYFGVNSNYGALRVYKQINGIWTQQGNKIKALATSTTNGENIVLSADGSTAVTGDPGDNNEYGAVYVFGPTGNAIVGSFTPTTAIAGTTVNITGVNFTGVTSVDFSGISAQSFTINSPTSITAVVAPIAAASSLNGYVEVKTASATSSFGGFNFVPVPIATITLLTDGSTNLTANFTYGYTFQWYKDGVLIAGATNAVYNAKLAGTYTLSISLNGLSQTSLPISFTPVFTLAAKNFAITITGASCKGSANGSIGIVAAQNLSYTATITGNGINASYPFSTTQTIGSLAAGTYNLCFTVAGQSSYSQCFTIVITEPKDLSVYSVVNPDHQSVSLSLKGGAVYNIQLNGVSTTTTDSLLTLPLATGNNRLIVTTDKLCQGVVDESIPLSGTVIPYPNPFDNTLNINMGYEKPAKATVEIYTAHGHLVYQMQFSNPATTIQLDVSGIKNTGVYSLKLTTDGSTRLFKILKK